MVLAKFGLKGGGIDLIAKQLALGRDPHTCIRLENI
jgi:hypothetical protein